MPFSLKIVYKVVFANPDAYYGTRVWVNKSRIVRKIYAKPSFFAISAVFNSSNLDTPFSCMVTPYSTSASSMVPRRWVIKMNWVFFSHTANILSVTRNVDVVKCRFNLVENTERRRGYLEYRKKKRNGGKSLFTAGEQVDVLNVFAGRLNLDFNVAAKHVALVLESKLRLTSAKQLNKGLPEA